MRWIVEDGMVFPVCKRCGADLIHKIGKDEYGFYLSQCPNCGKVEVTKTNPRMLAKKAMDRWWRR